jgi:prepilin-type processing-associated H-X9-DG protein
MPGKVGVVAGVAHTYAASSFHPSGINALMGDGSVRPIASTIDSWPFDPATGIPLGARRTPGGWWEDVPPPGVWQALGTRAGSEIVPGLVHPR